MVASIEIRAKELLPFFGQFGAYHSYTILTKSNNEKYILRAGPEGQNALTGDVYVVGADELVPYTFDTRDIHHDWDIDGTHLSHTQVTGTDAEMEALFDRMRAKGREINAEHYDYETVQQNCNTVTYSLMQAAGITTPALPVKDNKEVAFIGLGGGFTHGPIDNSIDYLREQYNDVYNGWVNYFDEVGHALTWGDPHLVTFDKSSYDFQIPGEYVLAKSTTDNFEIQVRQELLPGSESISLNSAVATHLNGTKVGLYTYPRHEMHGKIIWANAA